MRDRIHFKIDPMSIGTARGAARVIQQIVAVPRTDSELFDLFASGSDGEPIGECLGQAKLDLDSGVLESVRDIQRRVAFAQPCQFKAVA